MQKSYSCRWIESMVWWLWWDESDGLKIIVPSYLRLPTTFLNLWCTAQSCLLVYFAYYFSIRSLLMSWWWAGVVVDAQGMVRMANFKICKFSNFTTFEFYNLYSIVSVSPCKSLVALFLLTLNWSSRIWQVYKEQVLFWKWMTWQNRIGGAGLSWSSTELVTPK